MKEGSFKGLLCTLDNVKSHNFGISPRIRLNVLSKCKNMQGNLPSPLSSPRSLPASRSTSRVKTVMDQCASLSRDVSAWQKEIAGSISSSLTGYQTIKQELQDTSAPPTWRDSQQYIQAKERMKTWEIEKEDRQLSAQVSLLHKISSENAVGRKRVKLTLTKTQNLKGKKAKNVEKTLFLPLHMLKGFRTFRNLKQLSPHILTKSNSHTNIDEMDTYLKDEIEEFERNRKRMECEELLKTEQRRTAARTLTTERKVPLPLRERPEPRSSLERFLERYGDRRLLSQVAAERRRKATELKMNAIQPSLEIKEIARKYMQRPPKPLSKPASPRAKPSKPPSPRHFRTSYSRDSSLVDDLLAADAQEAHHDLHQLLHMATMVNLKNHHDRVHKGK